MAQLLSPRVEAVFWFLLTATGYFLLASLSLHATKGADNIAAVWPPSGYFLALLLLMPSHARARLSAFAGMASASFAANLWGGVPPLSCIRQAARQGGPNRSRQHRRAAWPRCRRHASSNSSQRRPAGNVSTPRYPGA